MTDFDARRRAREPARQAKRRTVRIHLAGDDLMVVGAHVCDQRDARVMWSCLTQLTPLQQDAYVERLFENDEAGPRRRSSRRPTWWRCSRRTCAATRRPSTT